MAAVPSIALDAQGKADEPLLEVRDHLRVAAGEYVRRLRVERFAGDRRKIVERLLDAPAPAAPRGIAAHDRHVDEIAPRLELLAIGEVARRTHRVDQYNASS